MNPLYFNLYAAPFLVSTVFYLLMGGYVLKQNVRSPLNISFAEICLSLVLWLGFTALMLSTTDSFWVMFAIKALYAGVSFISVSIYTYSSIWLGYAEKQKKFILFGHLLGVLFTLLIWFTPWLVSGYASHLWGRDSVLTPAGGAAYLLFFGFYMVTLFRNFLRGYRQAKDPLLKRQTRIVLIAFFIAYLGVLDFLPSFGIASPPVGCFSTLVLVCTLAYTIVRYKLLDIQTVIHKTIMWFATTVIAIAPFAALLYFIEDGLRSLPRAALTAALMALAAAFYFYFRLIQPRLNHLFRRRSANLQAALTQFSGELVHLKNLADMLRRFVRMLRRTVYVKQVSVYLRDETDAQFVPSLVKGVRGLKPYPASHAFLQWIEKRDEVIIGDLAEGDPEAAGFKEEVTAYFSETQALVAVPFVLGGKLIGVVHLGKKENLRKYTPTEIRFLSQMKSPMTIALSNSRQFENVSRLYKQVQVQNERLKELDRLKSEFLANTSHELRTPLHGILGLVESILDGADGDINNAQRAHLRMIIESGTNLKELINNLLELSRIESGQEILKVKPFNTLNVIDAVIALMEGIARKKNIRIRRTGPKVVSDVYGDPEKIQRVIMNLIGNAVKFTSVGEVIVRINEESARVTISVEDTGIGISPADQKLIFERFRQADGSSTREFEGTGLGLSIAREIVRLHGSDIHVESESGRGSKFSFSLSRTPFSVETSRPSEKEAPAETLKAMLEKPAEETYGSDTAYELKKDQEFEAAIRGNGEKILIVDDNPVNREVVKTRLEMNNYGVIEAADGLEGLEKCAKEGPALVILDLMMPRMSGYDFCRELRKGHPANELPIIMLTAKTQMGDKIYGLGLGANDYISKPFNKEELIARVGILLQIRKMTHELKKWNEELEQRVDERTHELVQTQQQLIQAEKLATIGTLAGGVAHEINNPLTAVLTNAQILKMGANPDDLETLSLIEEGAKRCQIIVQKLMKYARKPQEDELADIVDVNKVISNALALLDYHLRQDNIKIVITKSNNIIIQGNANELEQVITNLILNAKDAIKESGREGVIEIAINDYNGSVNIDISDDGIGILEKNLPKIFDPFFTTKEIGKGTGLGLAVTYGIVEKHGGRISVKSTYGRGTTFKLTFPKIKIPI